MQQNWLILPSYTKVVRVSKLTKSRRMQSHFADPRGFEKERPSKNKAALGHIFSLLIIHFLYKMQHQKTKGFSQEKMHCKCVKYMRSNSLVFHQKSALTLKKKNSLTLLWHQDIQILFHKDRTPHDFVKRLRNQGTPLQQYCTVYYILCTKK